MPPTTDPVGTLVFFLLVFVVVGVVFLFMHLAMGSVIRPRVPDAEKLTIYECGEPTVGSSWIQFDLRFYVVALLFVVFDVELALLFPWAVVFGRANHSVDAGAHQFAIIAFMDLLFFFGVLLVGFAYLWKRGDLDWVRSTAGQNES